MDQKTLKLWTQKLVFQPTGCITWSGALTHDGYARQGSHHLAHRLSYEHFVGPIRFELDHLCRVRHCVNPSHLEDVKRIENQRRGLRGVLLPVRTHCKSGQHEWIPQNIYTHKLSGKQRCWRCIDISNANQRKGIENEK